MDTALHSWLAEVIEFLEILSDGELRLREGAAEQRAGALLESYPGGGSE